MTIVHLDVNIKRLFDVQQHNNNRYRSMKRCLRYVCSNYSTFKTSFVSIDEYRAGGFVVLDKCK